jgi:hypothetical protein
MRFKTLVFFVAAALIAVSAAFAQGNPGKGKGGGKPACKANVTVMLSGVLAPDVDPQDGDPSFVLTVKRSNRHGRAYKTAGTATILVSTTTRISRQGKHNLGALAPMDRVHVKAKACMADLKNGATPDLTGRKVDAHPVATSS